MTPGHPVILCEKDVNKYCDHIGKKGLLHTPQPKSLKILKLKTGRTTQKVKFSMKDFFSKYDQIRSFLWIQSHLLKKSLIENFIFCTVLELQQILKVILPLLLHCCHCKNSRIENAVTQFCLKAIMRISKELRKQYNSLISFTLTY